jgi:hypothetical protein
LYQLFFAVASPGRRRSIHTKNQSGGNPMSVSNDSDFYTPTSDGSYGPGWVWGGGDAEWSYQGMPGGDAGTSALAQTIAAALQQQQSPPEQDWFAQANSMAMAAMVAAQTSSATSTQQAAAAPAYEPEPSPVVTYGWVSSGDGPDQWVPVSTWSPPPAPAEPAALAAQAPALPTAAPEQAAISYGWVSSGDGPDQWLPLPTWGAPETSSHSSLAVTVASAVNSSQDAAYGWVSSGDGPDQWVPLNTVPGTVAWYSANTAATVGSLIGNLASGQLMQQAANPDTDKSLGTIKTGANTATAGANRASSPGGGNTTGTTLTRVDTSPRPHPRTGELWEGGQGVSTIWNQYQADPYRLLQNIAEYGVTAQELAQASGQTVEQVAQYLSLAGAPSGLGGIEFVDRNLVHQNYLAALDETQRNGAPMDSAAAQAFHALYGGNPEQAGVRIQAGHWQEMGGGDSGETRMEWVPGYVDWQGAAAQTHAAITTYQRYTQASIQDLVMVDLSLNSEENLALLSRYQDAGVRDITVDTLPQNEQTERLRALYGSQRTVQMLQLMQAHRAVYEEFLSSAAQVSAQPPAIAVPERAFNDVWAPPPGQLTEQEAQATQLPQFWSWTPTQTNIEGNDAVIGTVIGYQAAFDTASYARWYAQQDNEASRLFAHRFGINPELNNRTTSWGWGEGTDPTFVTNAYVGNEMITNVNGHIHLALDASSELITLDVNNPRDDLIDPSQVFFDPVYGLVTSVYNVNDDDTSFDRFMMTAIPMVIVGLASWGAGTAAFGAAGGGTLGTLVGGAAGAATGTALMGFITTGRIDLEDVLKSALIGAATAGFAEFSGLNEAGLLTDARGSVVYIDGSTVVTNWATRIGTIGVNAAFSGLMSELAGGDFAQGAARFLAGRLGSGVAEQINLQLDSNANLSGMERAMGRSMATAVSTAIRYMADPSGSEYELAAQFLTSLGIDVLANPPRPSTGGTNWANTPVNGLTEDDGWSMSDAGNSVTNGGGNTTTASNTNTFSGGMTEADYWNNPAPSIATQYADTYGGQVSNTSFVDGDNDAGSSIDGDGDLDGGGGGDAVDAHDDTSSTGTQPYVQTALDDDGNVNPGVLDPNATPEQQYQQLQDRLIAQGLSPQQAQDIADNWLNQGGGVSTQTLPSTNNTTGQSSNPSENAQASPVLTNLRVTVLGGMRFYQWENENGETLTSDTDPRPPLDRLEPVPHSNHAEVSAAANARNTAIGQVMAEAQAQADAEALRLQMRQGIPGVLRGLNDAAIDTVRMPVDVYISLRDRGLLGTGLAIVNGMVEMPGVVWDALQVGDTQTLTSSLAQMFVGPRGSGRLTADVRIVPGAQSSGRDLSVTYRDPSTGVATINPTDSVSGSQISRLSFGSEAALHEIQLAAQLENATGSTIKMVDRPPPNPDGTFPKHPDFVFQSGPHAGLTGDFMFTDRASMAAINTYFDRNWPRTEASLNAHLIKADIVVLDFTNLTPVNQSRVSNWINSLSSAQRAQILIRR